jgi:CHASE2 domain-containing sensor protein
MYNQTKGIFTAFGARHVKGVAITRGVVAICFVVATVVLLALGHWWGVFFVLPAVLNGSLAYLVPHWNPRPDSSRTTGMSA